jgi:hypothetical protein
VLLGLLLFLSLLRGESFRISYNFLQVHRTLRTTPPMAAGVTDRLWDVHDLVALWESYEREKLAAAA